MTRSATPYLYLPFLLLGVYDGSPTVAEYDWVSYSSDVASQTPIPGTLLLVMAGLGLAGRQRKIRNRFARRD